MKKKLKPILQLTKANDIIDGNQWLLKPVCSEGKNIVELFGEYLGLQELIVITLGFALGGAFAWTFITVHHR